MKYELVYILSPKILEKEVKDKSKKILELLKKAGSKVEKEDFWGRRQLAYPIRHFDQGFYILVEFSAEPRTIKEIDKALKLQEEIIRFLIVKKEEKEALIVEEKKPTIIKEKIEPKEEVVLEKLDKELEEILGKKGEI